MTKTTATPTPPDAPDRTGVLQQADDDLCEIADLNTTIAHLQEKCEMEQKKLLAKYAAEIAPFEAMKDRCAKDLLALMQAHKGLIWGDAANTALSPEPHSEILRLENGELRYEVSTPVALPRKHEALIATLENLGAGWKEAVKVKKSLDKDAVNAWPDDKLTVAGLERKGPVESFDYTLKEKEESHADHL